MIGTGLSIPQVAVRAGRTPVAAILISSLTVAENTAAGTLIGTLSVVNTTGTPTFSLVDSAGSLAALDGSDIERGATALDYETTPSFSITVGVSGVTPSISDTVFTITVTDVDEVAPTILTNAAQTVAEGSPFSVGLTASEAVTWTKTGGADSALFTLAGSTLSLSAKDFESPTDADANNTYVVQVTATDAATNATNKTITVTVTDVDEVAPTITSGSTANVAENAQLSHALTANEAVTWSITGGADSARFELSGSTLRWASNGTKNYEAPDDANTDNAYVVQVTATDGALNATNQTITVTVTDVSEGGGGGTTGEPMGLLLILTKAA